MAKLCIYKNGTLIEVGNGDSAYETALAHGYIGTETEWLDSLHGSEVEIDPTTQEWIIDGINTHISAKGIVPQINQINGHWIIEGTDTGVSARASVIAIDNNTKHWMVDGVDTNVVAEGVTPYINGDGYWCIGTTVTDVQAAAITPVIRNGYWYIGKTNTGIKASGDALSIDSTTKNWIINGIDSGIKSEPVGISSVYSANGNLNVILTNREIIEIGNLYPDGIIYEIDSNTEPTNQSAGEYWVKTYNETFTD